MGKLLQGLRTAFSRHISFRMTLFFLLILLPLVGISLFANVRSTEILTRQAGERTAQVLRSVLDNVDLAVEDIEHLSLLITMDENLNPILSEAAEVPLTSDLFGFYTVIRRLENIVSIHGALKEISILHAPSGLLLSSRYGAKGISFEEEPWFQSMARSSGKSVVYIPVEGESSAFAPGSINFLRFMKAPDPFQTPNVLALTIDQTMLLEMIQGVQLSADSSVVLLSQEGDIIVRTGRPFPADPQRMLSIDEMGAAAGDRLIWKAQSEKSGWSLVLIQPKHELYEESKQLSQFTILIIGISLLLAFFLSAGVYKWISAPLKELLHGMQQMRLGKLHTRLENERNDEFGALKAAFNQMIEEQQRLIQDVYEHQLQLSKTELKFLQSQINPHFLYNTLDSIYWTAKHYDAQEISEMVLYLSKFFRLSLSKGREIFTVEETVEHLHYYLRVQQFRFLDQFSVRFDIEEGTKQLRVLKLLLQPIVENAILHGLEKRREGGKLVISSRLEGGRLCLEVMDNGAGMPEERLARIRAEIEKLEQQERETGILTVQPGELFGIRNVVGRMKLHYGPEAKFTVDSRLGEGTRVVLKIPAVLHE